MPNRKIGVVVPFRNRYEQLDIFKERITKYLTEKGIPYELIIVEQDDAKLFNRGMLLNIGFTYAEKLKCKYVVFHDIDMLPVDVDYSYSNIPLHLATDFIDNKRELFDTYFGGVTMFNIKDFKKINGYSNKYWGCGYEDTDLLYRCSKNNIELDTLNIKNQHSNKQKLKFNGIDAYVKSLNPIDLKTPTSIFISFKPDELTCDVNQYSDDFNIFTIPGYDFSIAYNSYSRYNICLFDKNNKALFTNSKITKDYYTNIIITIDEKNQEIKVYQDGEILETIKDFGELYDYTTQEYLYLGMGNPLSDSGFKYFKGLFDKLVVFEGILNEDEIKCLIKN